VSAFVPGGKGTFSHELDNGSACPRFDDFDLFVGKSRAIEIGAGTICQIEKFSFT
jgi:hypothetical protein